MTNLMKYTFLLAGLICLTAGEDPKVPEVIRKHGYSFEEHHVTTEDGYILTVFRIPSGRNLSLTQSVVPLKPYTEAFNPEVSPEVFENILDMVDYIAPDGYNGQSKETFVKNIVKSVREERRQDWWAVYREQMRNNSVYGTDPYESKQRPVIFLQHGLLSSSASWVLETGYQAPAFFFADAGYDVWLGNCRGSVYSRNHTTLNPKSYYFWEFSWDQMAKYDIPAVLDYITDASSQRQIYYVGHSMGTTMFYAALSERPEYNAKIKGMVGLAPVSSVSHIKTAIRYLSRFDNTAKKILDILGDNEFMPENSRSARLMKYLCKKFLINRGCESMLFMITGADYKELDVASMEKVSGQLLSGTSLNTVLQFGQEYQAGNFAFQKFDFGASENKAVYGQITPPQYNYDRIAVPVALMWGQNDYLADPTDVKNLAAKLPNVKYNKPVPCPTFNHLDFLWAKDAVTLVYEPVLRILKSFE